MDGEGSDNANSFSLIRRTGGSGRPPNGRGAAVVLKGRRVVKKTYGRNKLSKNVMGPSYDLILATDDGLVEEGTPDFVNDGDRASMQGEEGTSGSTL